MTKVPQSIPTRGRRSHEPSVCIITVISDTGKTKKPAHSDSHNLNLWMLYFIVWILNDHLHWFKLGRTETETET